MADSVKCIYRSIERSFVDTGRVRTFVTLEVPAEDSSYFHQRQLGSRVVVSDGVPNSSPYISVEAIPTAVLVRELGRRTIR